MGEDSNSGTRLYRFLISADAEWSQHAAICVGALPSANPRSTSMWFCSPCYLWVSLLLGLVNALIGPVAGPARPRSDRAEAGTRRTRSERGPAGGDLVAQRRPRHGRLLSSIIGARVISAAIALCEFTRRPFTRAG